jgi:hypothetical protein
MRRWRSRHARQRTTLDPAIRTAIDDAFGAAAERARVHTEQRCEHERRARDQLAADFEMWRARFVAEFEGYANDVGRVRQIIDGWQIIDAMHFEQQDQDQRTQDDPMTVHVVLAAGAIAGIYATDAAASEAVDRYPWGFHDPVIVPLAVGADYWDINVGPVRHLEALATYALRRTGRRMASVSVGRSPACRAGTGVPHRV